MKVLSLWITFAEVNFCMIMPIYLYGWKVGLLVASGLTSLLHIVMLLKKQQEGK
jgi:hypothetical protein